MHGAAKITLAVNGQPDLSDCAASFSPLKDVQGGTKCVERENTTKQQINTEVSFNKLASEERCQELAKTFPASW